MAKLSEITRKENCFITVDGYMLRTMQDISDYFLSCSEDRYNYHANAQKNDFANWATNVLLCPKLGKILFRCNNLSEARTATVEFLQKFDYKSKFIPSEKAFHTVEGYMLKSIHELYYYINNCDDRNFNYHCNSQKNDFANWVNDVLEFQSLSRKMRSGNTREGILGVLKEFLLNSSGNGINPEYERYINEHMILKDNTTSSNPLPAPTNVSLDDNTVTPVSNATPTVAVTDTAAHATLNKSEAETKAGTNDLVNGFIKDEEIITLKPLGLKERDDDEEEEKKDEAKLDVNSFRQYTDEELEKFTAFVRQEKSSDVDAKTEYLKSLIAELHNMIKELRRVEKDPFIADLMLRNVGTKVDYYALSKNLDDYNHIIRLMKDIQREIEECATYSNYNLADDMYKDLKLQGIALKKA